MSKATIKVKAVHRYNVDASSIYQTLLDPKKASKFMFATLTGKMVKAEIDPKVGGMFLFVDKRPEGEAAHYGRYTALEPGKQVAFKFGMQKELSEADQVTIDIKALPKGTEVVLTHEMSAEYEHLKERVIDGWDGILDGLGEALRKGG